MQINLHFSDIKKKLINRIDVKNWLANANLNFFFEL